VDAPGRDQPAGVDSEASPDTAGTRAASGAEYTAGAEAASDGDAIDAEPAPGAQAGAAAETPVAEGPGSAIDTAVAAPRQPARRARLHRPVGWLRRIRALFHLPRTRRGIAALLLVIGGIGSFFVVGAVQVIGWTETADFCGRCHTMGPELAAHESGPHRDVTCGQCHVEPGLGGWIKAKINGTRQLIQIVLGTFPEPIPPPDHASLPAPSETCLGCHSLSRLGTTALVTRTEYTADESNTLQFIGLLIRPNGGDVFNVSRSVHWHVLTNVQYRSDDAAGQSIRWVSVVRTDGSMEQWIRQDEVRLTEDVTPDIERIKTESAARPMDCITCHNRVGHPLPDPRRTLNAAMAAGLIDPELPYIKREGLRLLWSNFPSNGAADTEIGRLRDFYALRYPDVAKNRASAINAAIYELETLYRLSATPIMKVTASTYPDNLGHMDFPGCFRCHDGGHYLVRNGVLTKETIPSSCDTCHTFPQIGGAIASLPLGRPPATHDDRLWVFNHRLVAAGVDPGTNSCGNCHARDYCSNCHQTGAVTVDHDQMLTNHAAVIRTSGNGACVYCHQPVFCARCHSEPVLPGAAPVTKTGVLPTPTGLEWPLLAVAAQR
jgi:nitrate/TMAO reductase-like tetraheme cytochrome c subunit